MNIWFLILVPIMFVACTYSISMVHTEGTASNVGDETSTPTISIPNI